MKSKPTLNLLMIVCVLASFSSSLFAGLETSTKPFPLMVGDQAPPIRVSAFHKGQPIAAFQKGQIYVIEFWATWCGPCKDSIPHLAELQRKFGEKVRIVGVSVWEPRERDVAPFVKEWDDRMAYTVASDLVEGVTTADEEKRSREAVDKGVMSKTYLVDSGWSEDGIPQAFIVDKEGRIAWIGNPISDKNQMDTALAEVVADRYDLAGAISSYRKIIATEVYARSEKAKAREAGKANDFGAAAKHWDNVFALGPKYEYVIINKYVLLLMKKKAPDEAAALLASSAPGLDWTTTMDMAATLAYEATDLEARHLRGGIEACRIALAKLGRDHTWPLMTMAAMHYRLGENDKAVALVDRALLIAKDNDKKSFRETRDKYAKGGGSLKEPPR